MLTKKKNIRKQSPFFFSKIQKRPDVWLSVSNNQNLKEIRAIDAEIIDATDRRDRRRTNFDFMSSAYIHAATKCRFWQSQS